jgi:hydroxymethylpyrimidine pyrophosphatase-like HAD family hydrolase
VRIVFVDLDGTLLKGSTSSMELKRHIKIHGVVKSLSEFIRNRLFTRLTLKNWLSTQPTTEGCEFEFNLDVIKILEKLHSQGHLTVLATASPPASALRALNQAPIIIEEVLSSSKSVNLKGTNKLKAIEEMVQRKNCIGFIYLGDAFIDLKIMKKAHESYFAGSVFLYLIGKYLLKVRNMHRIVKEEIL